MNKKQAIEQVNASVGSLFTKSDVIAIINSLETAPTNMGAITSELIEEIRQKMSSLFTEMESDAEDTGVDTDDAEFGFESNNRVFILNPNDLRVIINGSSAKDWVRAYEREWYHFVTQLEKETTQKFPKENEI